jgi:hypothetical protein
VTSYKNYTDEDLMEAYTSMMDYSGKPSDELLNEIGFRGGMDAFQEKLTQNKLRQQEIEQVTNKVYLLCRNAVSLDHIKSRVNSGILSKEELEGIVENSYYRCFAHQEDIRVDSDTIVKTLLAGVAASISGSLLWGFTLSYFSEYAFILLGIISVVCFILVQVLSGKTKNNVVVFLTAFVSILISYFAGFFLVKYL